jgi:hypothetical protein
VAGTHRLLLYSGPIGLLDEDLEMEQLLLDAGWGVSREAAALARKRTGRGAASIRPWPGHGPAGPHVDVSWDRNHFYMIFHETGTTRIAEQPAIGPALDHYLHL